MFLHGELPDTLVQKKDTHECTGYIYRFDPMPEAGETKGLLLALDGHSDLVTPSSVTEAFRVTDR